MAFNEIESAFRQGYIDELSQHSFEKEGSIKDFFTGIVGGKERGSFAEQAQNRAAVRTERAADTRFKRLREDAGSRVYRKGRAVHHPSLLRAIVSKMNPAHAYKRYKLKKRLDRVHGRGSEDRHYAHQDQIEDARHADAVAESKRHREMGEKAKVPAAIMAGVAGMNIMNRNAEAKRRREDEERQKRERSLSLRS